MASLLANVTGAHGRVGQRKARLCDVTTS